jgi:hypothetical protein
LPKSVFGLPGSLRFLMDTPGRTINAKARATQMEERGELSPSTAAKIRAKANRRLKVNRRRLAKRR